MAIGGSGNTEASPSDFTADDYYPLDEIVEGEGEHGHHHQLQQRWNRANNRPTPATSNGGGAGAASAAADAGANRKSLVDYCSPPALARGESSTATLTTLGGNTAGGRSSSLRALHSDAGSSSLVMLVAAEEGAGGGNDTTSRRSFGTATRVLCDESANTTPLLYPGNQYDQDNDDDDDDYDGNRYLRPSLSSLAATPRVLYSTRRKAQLNGLNYLNVVTYLLHLFVSWGIGVWGLGGHVQTRWEIANEHETLVTPSAFTLWIWYPILVLEGVFAIAQLLPHYRARPIVQGGTSYWFFYTFVIQTGWTLFYSFRLFIFSFVAVLAALASLVGLLASQQASLVHEGSSYGNGLANGGNGLFGMRSASTLTSSHRTRAGRLTEYYLFRFPFYLHTGWMAFCAAHHFSLLFRSYDAGVGLQVAIDIVSLGWLLPTALIFLACPHFKDFVIPLVIIWSYVGVACRLLHPSDAMMTMFGPVVVDALRIASIFFAGTVGLSLIPNIFVWLAREFCTISIVELDE